MIHMIDKAFDKAEVNSLQLHCTGLATLNCVLGRLICVSSLILIDYNTKWLSMSGIHFISDSNVMVYLWCCGDIVFSAQSFFNRETNHVFTCFQVVDCGIDWVLKINRRLYESKLWRRWHGNFSEGEITQDNILAGMVCPKWLIENIFKHNNNEQGRSLHGPPPRTIFTSPWLKLFTIKSVASDAIRQIGCDVSSNVELSDIFRHRTVSVDDL